MRDDGGEKKRCVHVSSCKVVSRATLSALSPPLECSSAPSPRQGILVECAIEDVILAAVANSRTWAEPSRMQSLGTVP